MCSTESGKLNVLDFVSYLFNDLKGSEVSLVGGFEHVTNGKKRGRETLGILSHELFCYIFLFQPTVFIVTRLQAG
jgi:hypothetical protein